MAGWARRVGVPRFGVVRSGIRPPQAGCKERGSMAHERLVAVSYPVDGEFTSINAGVLGDLATLSYTDGMPEDERAEVLRQAEVLIGLRLQREVPAGALRSAPGLRFIQMLSAGLDTVDFDVIAPDIMVAGNVGAY